MGAKRLLRLGAARRAMWSIEQASQRRRGADLPRLRPGDFAPWRRCEKLVMRLASLRIPRLARTQNHPGQMVPIYLDPL